MHNQQLAHVLDDLRTSANLRPRDVRLIDRALPALRADSLDAVTRADLLELVQEHSPQVVQGGIQRTVHSWRTVAAGAAGAMTVGALLAGGLAPLITLGMGTAALTQLLTSLGGNALAGWLADWATQAGDRALADPNVTQTALARELSTALSTNTALADDIATLLNNTHGIQTSLAALDDQVDAQTDLLLALHDDLRQNRLVQGRLHRLVVAQVNAGTQTIITELHASHTTLSANQQQMLAQLEHLAADLKRQSTPAITAHGSNVAVGNTVKGDLNQTVQHGGVNLGSARIGSIGRITGGDEVHGDKDE